MGGKYLIPIRIVSKAAKEGVALPELQDMLLRSARFTHPSGNRRFHDYLFNIEGRKVVGFRKLPPEGYPKEKEFYKCDYCKDTRRISVFDPCPKCDGEGCSSCDEGLVPSSIPCTSCADTKKVRYKRW